ncbi:MAG TPA: tripartite tricarboxylate transporter substrate-binding protein [Pseudolabrys sp.]|nr:tripartite tricarboxylate transporter substrate-binding protein [Pseudolabrys sp.]
MDVFSNLALGFSVSLQPLNLLLCFAGVVLGVIIGILPGLGSAATIALLLPITYFLDTTTAVIMLAGIWYGSMYGGSITSILLRVPGESASVMVAIDGYELTKQGRAGAALGMSMFSAFIAGMFGLLGLGLVAPTLAEFALDFGPPEYFALTLLGLTLVSYLATDSIWKAIAVTILGLLLGTVGLDPVRSSARFTFGTLNLQTGIDLVPMVMGLFGISEVFHLIESKITGSPSGVTVPKGLLAVLPTKEDWRNARRAIGQGTLVGFFVGLLPGGGATISSYVAYAVAKRWGLKTQKFGEGAISGVAAPESAANAATCSGFIPLLTLGLPDNVVMALILGAFMLHGVTPGPTLMMQHPQMFWAIVTSMFIGNCILIVTMLPMIGVLSKITLIPPGILVPIIVLACLAGAYGVNNNPVDIITMTGFGMLGYLMTKFGFPHAPMILAFVLGPIMETSLRQSLIMSGGDFLIFWSSPVAAFLMSLLVFIVAVPILRKLILLWRHRRKSPDRVTSSASAIISGLVLLALLVPATAHAQDYPTKPITLIVPYPPGGRTDLCGRAVAQYLKQELGQPVVVVNKPGAGGVLGAKEVAAADPDGYTLGIFSTGFLTAQYTVPTPTDAADYEMIAMINMDPAVIAVAEDPKWKTLPDYVDYARKNPDKLRVGIDPGSSAQIYAAAFSEKTNIKVIYVPFRGGGERTVALAGHHIDATFDILAPLKTMRDAKKIRVLGVAAEQRVEEYPDIPTMKEGGVDLVISSWHGIFAPKGTPSKVIARINQAVKKVAQNSEFRARMRDLYLGVHYLDTDQFKKFFADADEVNLSLIRKLGLLVSQPKH